MAPFVHPGVCWWGECQSFMKHRISSPLQTEKCLSSGGAEPVRRSPSRAQSPVPRCSPPVTPNFISQRTSLKKITRGGFGPGVPRINQRPELGQRAERGGRGGGGSWWWHCRVLTVAMTRVPGQMDVASSPGEPPPFAGGSGCTRVRHHPTWGASPAQPPAAGEDPWQGAGVPKFSPSTP